MTGAKRIGVRVRLWLLPALRIRQEQLDRLSPDRVGVWQRVGGVYVGTEQSHASTLGAAADTVRAVDNPGAAAQSA